VGGSGTVLFSKSVNEQVEKIKEQYSLGYISLYFRDLNEGQWAGVNEKEVFSPASLLKVPLLISLLHQAENEPNLLNKKVIISADDLFDRMSQNINFENNVLVNQEYSIWEITESMIKKSDNTATAALIKNIKNDDIGSVFRSVGVPYKDSISEVDVRVKDYAGFFRILYNASYLNREMSEKALELLTESEYKDGIVAGVPSNIKVAHKFGERSFGDLNTDLQLHDCGIVYYPNKPYILCIMTRGNDFKNQAKSIRDLSKYIYGEVGKDYIGEF
jgi:beta-lactamase class A